MALTKHTRYCISDGRPLSNGDGTARNNEQSTTDLKRWLSIDLGRMGYHEAWTLQENIIAARRAGLMQNDIVLFLEHPPVFTLGRRGGRECLLVSETFLAKAGIPIIQVERGGNITYHGPGQLVVYPIVNLQAAGIKVVDFVSGLEAVMLRTAQNWGIASGRSAANRGIWVGPKKLGSIGIAVRRGISFHGLALNVNTDLTPFSWIEPCGLHNIEMTSMQQESTQTFSMQQVRAVLKRQFEAVFGVKFVAKSPNDLCATLENLTPEPLTDRV